MEYPHCDKIFDSDFVDKVTRKIKKLENSKKDDNAEKINELKWFEFVLTDNHARRVIDKCFSQISHDQSYYDDMIHRTRKIDMQKFLAAFSEIFVIYHLESNNFPVREYQKPVGKKNIDFFLEYKGESIYGEIKSFPVVKERNTQCFNVPDRSNSIKNSINTAVKQFCDSTTNLIFLLNWGDVGVNKKNLEAAFFGTLGFGSDVNLKSGVGTDYYFRRDIGEAKLRKNQATRVSAICFYQCTLNPLCGNICAVYHNPFANKKLDWEFFKGYPQHKFQIADR